MAPGKRGSVNLETVRPSAEELQEADRILNSASDPAKKLKATMANFAAWLKGEGMSENAEVLLIKPKDRTEYLKAFMVWQARVAKNKCTTTAHRTVEEETEHTSMKRLLPVRVREVQARGKALARAHRRHGHRG